MRDGKRYIILLIVLILVLSGCENEKKNTTNQGLQNEGGEQSSQIQITDEDVFSDRDLETGYDEEHSVLIKLEEDKASCTSDAVNISESTITLSGEGTYVFEGTLENGMIVVTAGESDKVQIVLNGAAITSETSAAIYVMEADKVFVTLAENSENYLANGGSFEMIDENNIDGAIYSKADVTINGTGSLEISSPAGHGIVAKDDLVITGGTQNIVCADHGIDANDSLCYTKAKLVVKSGKDGIHVENEEDETKGFVYIQDGSFDISSEGDGISASAYVKVLDGTFSIITGGGAENGEKQTSDAWGNMGGHGGPGMGGPGMGGHRSGSTETSVSETEDDSTSIKGLKAGNELLIAGGTFTIDSADDALHSNGSVYINGGTFDIETGDDGVHGEETLEITSCDMVIQESYEGLEALHLSIKGGTIKLTASDDGLNAAGGTDSSGFGGPRGDDMFGGKEGSADGSIVIEGGDLYIYASGDGIDANGTIEISGGHTVVVGPTQGDTATLDYDTTATISGGTFIGTGAAGMAQTFSDSEQGTIAVSVGNQAANTKIVLKDASGKEIISYTPELSFAVVILSSEEIKKGETYTITVGDVSGDFEA